MACRFYRPFTLNDNKAWASELQKFAKISTVDGVSNFGGKIAAPSGGSFYSNITFCTMHSDLRRRQNLSSQSPILLQN